MSDPKTPAPDPEIPDELRSKLSRPKRPAGYVPKSADADEDNPQEEKTVVVAKDLTDFWGRLHLVLTGGKFYKQVIEERETKKRIPSTKQFEYVREKISVKVEVALQIGADGLPYTSEAVTREEMLRVRSLSYPDAPKMDALIGDLTPAFVEWLYLNHPYDAAVRYYARSTHVQADAVHNIAS